MEASSSSGITGASAGSRPSSGLQRGLRLRQALPGRYRFRRRRAAARQAACLPAAGRDCPGAWLRRPVPRTSPGFMSSAASSPVWKRSISMRVSRSRSRVSISSSRLSRSSQTPCAVSTLSDSGSSGRSGPAVRAARRRAPVTGIHAGRARPAGTPTTSRSCCTATDWPFR